MDIKDSFWIKNVGSNVANEFSRSKYLVNISRQKYGNVLSNFEIKIPVNAYGIKLKDELGYIHSNRVQQHESHTSVYIKLRYPLAGGWETKFFLEYSVPFQYQFTNGIYTTDMEFGCFFVDFSVEKASLKVLLPEGSHEISHNLPFNVRESRSHERGFLEFTGKSTINFILYNAVQEHMFQFQLAFKYPFWKQYQKLILSASLLVSILFIFRSRRLRAATEKDLRSTIDTLIALRREIESDLIKYRRTSGISISKKEGLIKELSSKALETDQKIQAILPKIDKSLRDDLIKELQTNPEKSNKLESRE